MGLAESTNAGSRAHLTDISPTTFRTQTNNKPDISASDSSGRVAMLADGTCAFYNKHRNSTTVLWDCQSETQIQKNNPELLGIVKTDTENCLQQISVVPLSETPINSQKNENDFKYIRQILKKIDKARRTELRLSVEEDGRLIRGWIRILMNLKRPPRENSSTQFENNERVSQQDSHSFLEVTSETTTNEVIESLLKNNKIVTSPRKFALYERYYEHGQTTKVLMRRLSENEKPLLLALRWSQETDFVRKFLLQENESGDILWEAFTLPELTNFLKILDREEEEYIKMIQQKYQIFEEKIQEAIRNYERK